MLLIQCVNAYLAVIELMEREWDYETAHTLMELKRELKPQVDFFQQEEEKLALEFGKKDERGRVAFTERGTFQFQNPEDGPKYNGKRRELGQVEVELKWRRRTLARPERIRAVHLEALEDFIRFGGGE